MGGVVPCPLEADVQVAADHTLQRSGELRKAETTPCADFNNLSQTQSLNLPLLANFWDLSPPQPTSQLHSDFEFESATR